MKIQILNENPNFLESVIKLGDKNNSTLGFYPEGAYQESARKKKIIIATDSERVLGYLLWNVSVTMDIASIVHLCVDEDCRRQGVAEKLFSRLLELTDEFRGIRVHCRRDYEANRLWPKLGFLPKGEKPGRSKHGSRITKWWYENNKPDLFSKINVVLDTNILIDLSQFRDDQKLEAYYLNADWLTDLINFHITPETFLEIDKHPDELERERMRNYLTQFHEVRQKRELQCIIKEIRALYPDVINERTQSDIHHIAYTISSDVRIFVTRDKELLDLSDEVSHLYSIEILRPTELIIRLDSLTRNLEYQPSKLSGSNIRIHKAIEQDLDQIVSNFRMIPEEKRDEMLLRIGPFLADPRKFDTQLIKDNKKYIALIVIDK
ncbi:MAG: GNAT family N-acetyltransferase, partial [Calditrichaeota bacterium]|nr:GNAT family N-acetyltransferase [Calditrichota bacterium]